MLSLLKATALLTAGFSAFASADEVHIDSVSPSVSVGQKVNVTWTSDANYTLQLLLVQATGPSGTGGWASAEEIFNHRKMSPGTESYIWKVPNVDSDKTYALWLSGSPLEGDDETRGYADLTPWWKIPGGTLVGSAGLTTAQIVGLVIGVLVVFSGLVAAAWFLIRRRRGSAASQTALVPPMYEKHQPIDTRGSEESDRKSMDSIEVEKEKARLAAKRMDV